MEITGSYGMVVAAFGAFMRENEYLIRSHYNMVQYMVKGLNLWRQLKRIRQSSTFTSFRHRWNRQNAKLARRTTSNGV
jgi:hypothetical protein